MAHQPDNGLIKGARCPVTKNATTQDDESYNPFTFHLEIMTPALARCIITVPSDTIATLYEEAALGQQINMQAPGFIRGKVPTSYIIQNFKDHLVDHVKELLLKLAITNFLYQEMRLRKLITTGNPRLTTVDLKPGEDAQFVFDVNLYHELPIYEWKYLPFRAPKRKRYKDLDRQVKLFMTNELESMAQYSNEQVGADDWVSFDISIANSENKCITPELTSNFWYKVGNDEIEGPLREVFIGRSIGDVIYTRNKGLQEHFSRHIDSNYNFQITIKDIIPHNYFSIEDFKKHFRIKTKKDTHEKLVEVFSYRNHISQRRAMAQDAITLLLSKHHIEIPSHAVLRQQRAVLERVRMSPDYNVYRTQPDFEARVNELAEKEICEALFTDAFAYSENLAISDYDTRCYLNLLNRPRMKDFIYFELPSSKILGQEIPLPAEEVKRICLREKAINHAIHHLTKE